MTIQPHIAARQTLVAFAAGMPLKSARRWPLYLAMKARKGQQPIALDEAVEQCKRASGATA